MKILYLLIMNSFDHLILTALRRHSSSIAQNLCNHSNQYCLNIVISVTTNRAIVFSSDFTIDRGSSFIGLGE